MNEWMDGHGSVSRAENIIIKVCHKGIESKCNLAQHII